MAWSRWFDLTSSIVANEAPTTCGVFCIARAESTISYPAGASATVLLGVAPDRQRGLRAILAEIARGTRPDLAVQGQLHGLRFCFQGNLGDAAGGIHKQLLEDFKHTYGAPPCCNESNQ
ncbi:MAG: hypothetical protein JNK05_35640 [Myxococcales bacterium]|nr:hypothetical protein [Myxococcales bacterium]